MSNPPVHYKVFVRVPFPRGQFVDPPDPKWNSAKDKELWRILSSTSKGKDTDWNGLADKFEVTLPFLLQQAAWLYDRQLSQVREQLRRVKPNTPSVAASPTPPLDSASASAVGAQPMRRLGSAASGARVSSHLSARPRNSLDGPREGSITASPIQERPQRGLYSRQISAATTTQPQRAAFTSETVQAAGLTHPAQSTNASVIRRPREQTTSTGTSPKASPSPSESSSDDDGIGKGHGMGQSRAFARRPQFSRIINKGKAKAGRLSSVASEDASNESDSDEEYLPFANTASKHANPAPSHIKEKARVQNLHIRSGTATQAQRPELQEPKTPRAGAPSATASALSSSPSGTSSSVAESGSMSQRSMSNPVDRAHRSPLNALSPKQRRSIARDGSDTGSPSMGSSFSDLDDASVNTSAMEEALATQMRAGGLGAASALRSSLAVGGRLGGLWRGTTQGGQGQG